MGGAVRDQLLDFPVTERDWVVVGATPEEMLKKGYRPVGKDFPVFLHPKTHDEYALARTEKKTAPGYKGFIVHAEPDVRLEDDLRRRDLTINAMAQMPDGRIFDPFGGQQDLKEKLLRHISMAFCEDPVRVLRVARFTARYAHLGFCVAPETVQLMQQMVSDGEVDHLVPERVWAETVKALAERTPTAYFQTLRDCHAMSRIFPELERLFGVPQPEKYHPEIDTGIHSMLALEQAVKLSAKTTVRFAALVHDLGKAVTPKEKWPSHHGHETAGLEILEKFCQRLRVPNQYKKLAANVMRYHTHCHKATELRPGTIAELLTNLGAFKPKNDLDDFLTACEADAKGRTGLEHHPYPQARFLVAAQQAALSVDTSEIFNRGLLGTEIGQAIHELRSRAIASYKREYNA